MLFAAELGFHVGVPIGIYGLVAGLLGLGELVEALSGIRPGAK